MRYVTGNTCIRYVTGNTLYQVRDGEHPVSGTVRGTPCIRYVTGNALYQVRDGEHLYQVLYGERHVSGA
jgi:hypothetical protein